LVFAEKNAAATRAIFLLGAFHLSNLILRSRAQRGVSKDRNKLNHGHPSRRPPSAGSSG
jgi:hypothetical protein